MSDENEWDNDEHGEWEESEELTQHEREVFGEYLVDGASIGDPDVLEIFLGKGVDVNCHNLQGFTPLLAAAFAGKHKVIKVLLDWGANIHIRHKTGLTLMECALTSKDKETILCVIGAGAKLFEAIERETRFENGIINNAFSEGFGFSKN